MNFFLKNPHHHHHIRLFFVYCFFGRGGVGGSLSTHMILASFRKQDSLCSSMLLYIAAYVSGYSRRTLTVAQGCDSRWTLEKKRILTLKKSIHRSPERRSCHQLSSRFLNLEINSTRIEFQVLGDFQRWIENFSFRARLVLVLSGERERERYSTCRTGVEIWLTWEGEWRRSIGVQGIDVRWFLDLQLIRSGEKAKWEEDGGEEEAEVGWWYLCACSSCWAVLTMCYKSRWE
jgi:hypothetical protein